jgi:phospholipid/cholesterol/gamma-HCH transport system substrate-binding protein
MNNPLPRRRRREVSKVTPRWVVLGVGAAGALVLVVLAVVGYIAPNGLPLRSYYNLQANFSRADGLVTHTDIKLDGKRVGQVLRPRLKNGKVIADLQLDGGTAPLRSDSILRVRPRGLLGVVYVEIVPGAHGRILQDGAVIGAGPGRSTSTVQLDDVLSTFDRRTRIRAQTLLRELGSGVTSRGQDLNRLLAQGPGYAADIAATAQALNARAGAPGRFVRGSEQAFAALDPVRADLGASLDPSARSAAPFADRAEQWRETLSLAPGTLRTVRSGLATTDPLLVSVDRLAQQLTTTLEPAPRAFRDTGAFLREARPALARVPATLTLARRATDPTVTFAARLDTQLPLVSAALKPALPIARELGPRTCDFRAFFGHWAGMNSLGDEGLNYLRASASIGNDETLGTYQTKQPLTHSNPYPAPCEAGYEYLRK